MKFIDKLESLKATYKKENSKVAVRMLAVLMILKDDKELEHATKTLHRCTNCVRKLVDRFKEDCLDDHPKSGNSHFLLKVWVETRKSGVLFVPSHTKQSLSFESVD